MGPCPFVCDDSWRGPTHTLMAGCTRAGTVATTLMRGSPMGPAGTRCPKVSKTSSPEQKGRQQKCVVKAQETHLRLAFVIELIVIETKLFTRCLHLFLASESASGFILCCFGTTKVSAVAQHQQH